MLAMARLAGMDVRAPTTQRGSIVLIVAAGAGSLLLAGFVLGTTGVGHLSQHMMLHIVLMSMIAPITAGAWFVLNRGAAMAGLARTLLPATIAQLAALWFVHAPAVMQAALGRPTILLLIHASLYGFSLWFWLAIMAAGGGQRWWSILALLFTAKLFCLLGVLLVFAPRSLYAYEHNVTGLADQQLSGLLMLAACPLTYLVAGVVIAAQWLNELGATSNTQQGRQANGSG